MINMNLIVLFNDIDINVVLSMGKLSYVFG